jgi:hypothetical protein
MPIGKIYQPPNQALNFSVDWDMMPSGVKKAFIGKPTRIKLENGFKLYKFTEFGFSYKKISEWWFPAYSYGPDPGLEARLNLAKLIGVHPSDLLRTIGAVQENWNALSCLLIIRLRKPVYCLWGQCSMQYRVTSPKDIRNNIVKPQHREDMPLIRSEKLTGYAWQFYIPKLSSDNIELISISRILT